VCRTSKAYSNVQFSPTDAASASQFQSKVIFDEIEKRLREVWFLIVFLPSAWKVLVGLLLWIV